MTVELIEAEADVLGVGFEPEEAIVEVMRSTSLAPLGVVDAGIAKLREAYAGKTYDVTITAGLDDAKKARAAIREARYRVPHIVKAQKEKIAQIGVAIEAEGDRIVGALLELENPIHEQIKNEETRKAAEKLKRETEQREAKERIDAAIAAIVGLPAKTVGGTAADIRAAIDWIEAYEVSLETFGDDAGRVMQAKNEARERLAFMHGAAVTHEQAQQKLIDDRAELARQQQESAANLKAENDKLDAQRRENEKLIADQRAELDRMQAEANKRQAALTRAENERREESERIERERRHRADDVARRIDAIRDEVAANKGLHSSVIQHVIDGLNALDCSTESFDERAGDAMRARDSTVRALQAEFVASTERERLRAEKDAADELEREAAAKKAAASNHRRDHADALHDMLTRLLACDEIRLADLSDNAKQLIKQANALLALATLPT